MIQYIGVRLAMGSTFPQLVYLTKKNDALTLSAAEETHQDAFTVNKLLPRTFVRVQKASTRAHSCAVVGVIPKQNPLTRLTLDSSLISDTKLICMV